MHQVLPLKRRRSAIIYERACRSMVGGVSSSARAFQKVGIAPLIAASAQGDLLYDADGRAYIDYCCSWGALILGHSPRNVVAAVSKQVAQGVSYGLTCEVEEHLASQIVDAIPSIEKLRFVASGTEACMTAVRLARKITSRPNIVAFEGHYHGHAETLLSPAQGLLLLPFNDLASLRAFFASEQAKTVAAVIVEPIPTNMGLVHPVPSFLAALRELTHESGSLLIFDEVVTAFRLGLAGVQGLFHIEPDLTTLGKIIGGGFPLAALGGKADLMDHLAPLGSIFHGGTMSGHPVAARAGLAVLSSLKEPPFYPTLLQKSRRLLEPIEKALRSAKTPACLQQEGSLFTLFFGARSVSHKNTPLDESLFQEFFQTLLMQGILIPPMMGDIWSVSMAHTEEHLDYTAGVVSRFVKTRLS